MRTETVCSEFWSVYANITGIEALARSQISASHDLHSGRPGFDADSARTSEGGPGRSAEVSVVMVSEAEPLGIMTT